MYENTAPEAILRMEEEYSMTLREAVEQERHNLDLFNLGVAKFRLKYGMSHGMVRLYECMGRLSRELILIEKNTASIGAGWKAVTGIFQLMKDKEGSE